MSCSGIFRFQESKISKEGENCNGIEMNSSETMADEVQRSNMSKLSKGGKPIYNEHGKVMKGPDYFKPDLSKFITKD